MTRNLADMSWLRRRPTSPFAVGVVFLTITAIVLLALAFKDPISTFLRSGETITAEFGQNYQLRPDDTVVKVAGLDVGVVSDVETTGRGTALVSMKVDESVLDMLGPKPSAVIAPKTLLGGHYAVELKRGGGYGRFTGESIPRERTRTPVELDRILESLPLPTRQSLRGTVRRLDDTLASGGTDAFRDLIADAPDTLEPAGAVLRSAQGTRAGVDLPEIVSNFHTMARVLSEHDGQLADIITSLRDTTTVLAAESEPLAAGIDSLPSTLRATRRGAADLGGTLQQLTATAHGFRRAASRLEPLLRELEPVLRNARPLMRDLRPLMRDARPLVDQLVPVAQRGTRVLDDLAGPVLDRVNGPITETVMNTWRGSGPYRGSGGGMQADHKFYEELGYLVANVDRGSMTQDAQGAMLGFQVGAGSRTLDGTPFTLRNLIKEMNRVVGGAR